MARVFTLKFDFWGERNHALVSVSNHSTHGIIYTIRLLNKELHQLIENGHIILSIKEKEIHHHEPGVKELINCIKKEIYHFLSSNSPNDLNPQIEEYLLT